MAAAIARLRGEFEVKSLAELISTSSTMLSSRSSRCSPVEVCPDLAVPCNSTDVTLSTATIVAGRNGALRPGFTAPVFVSKLSIDVEKIMIR